MIRNAHVWVGTPSGRAGADPVGRIRAGAHRLVVGEPGSRAEQDRTGGERDDDRVAAQGDCAALGQPDGSRDGEDGDDGCPHAASPS